MLFLVQYLQSIPIEHVNISKVARAITNLIQKNIYFFKLLENLSFGQS